MEKLKVNKGVNVTSGLSDEQVTSRKRSGLVNKTYEKTTKSYARIIFGNIFTFFNIICFVVAGFLIAVKSYENALFIFIFLANLLIEIIQEIRAKVIVDRISIINTSTVEVLRNGKIESIKTNEVVKDDIFFLKTGSQICADGVLLSGEVEVNESMLTGESKPIKKKRGDSLYAGSYVITGKCKAMATVVGLGTYNSKLITKAKEVKSSQSDILKTLNIIMSAIGIIIIPLGILTYLDLRTGNELSYIIKKTAGAVIGMMPVGMFLLTTVSLTVGVINLATKQTLVQNLYSIEMLSRTDILCLDKTGTLTDGTLTVESVIPLSVTSDFVIDTMQNFIGATQTENATSIALGKYFWKDPKTLVPAKKIIAFTSRRKFTAAQFEKEGIFVLGAPEIICPKLDVKIKKRIDKLTSLGYRALLFCKSSEKTLDEKKIKNGKPIAIITMRDNIRPDAKPTIEWFYANKVDIKVISGDNVNTIMNIAKNVGIKEYDKAISLENLTDKEIEDVATKYSIFARVTPKQKYIIIKALKESGKRVSMVGDGINDILALKEADCAIAMANGNEATRSTSDMIMLDNNFGSMPSIVSEGLRVINNISKVSSLFLTKTFFTIFLTIFTLISPFYDYPLQPDQILLWESLFIGIPSFFLALQPYKEGTRVNTAFSFEVTAKAIPGTLTLFLATIFCYLYCTFTNQPTLISTLISYSVTFGAFFILLNVCYPLDKYRSIVSFSLLGVCLIGFAIIPKKVFDFMPIGWKEILLIAALLCFIYFTFPLIKKLFEHLIKRHHERKASKA